MVDLIQTYPKGAIMNTIKSMLTPLGYREWKMVSLEVRPSFTKITYVCQVTGKSKVEISYVD
jgi:hypothetical protein